MSQELYYTAPTDHAFRDMQAACLIAWSMMIRDGADPEYIREKQTTVLGMANIRDNFMSMPAMFDPIKLATVLDMVESATVKEFSQRMS